MDSAYAAHSDCKRLVKKNIDSLIFKVSLGCQQIGGGREIKTIKCPDIYLSLQFETRPAKGKPVHYRKLIPFVFEAFAGSFQRIIINDIDLENYSGLSDDPIAIQVDVKGNYSIIKPSIRMPALKKFVEIE